MNNTLWNERKPFNIKVSTVQNTKQPVYQPLKQRFSPSTGIKRDTKNHNLNWNLYS